MIVTLQIPDAEIEKSPWHLPGMSLIRLRTDPGTDLDVGYVIIVRDEWIVGRS